MTNTGKMGIPLQTHCMIHSLILYGENHRMKAISIQSHLTLINGMTVLFLGMEENKTKKNHTFRLPHSLQFQFAAHNNMRQWKQST